MVRWRCEPDTNVWSRYTPRPDHQNQCDCRTMRLPHMFMLLALCMAAHSHAADEASLSRIGNTVDEAIRPVMQAHGIPGMAVAVTINGQRHLFDYGVASRDTQQPVTRDTLFEIGSITKTFTATLATWAQDNGKLSLSDSPGKYLPALRGSSIDQVRLLHLGTHTAGGLPLQVPDAIGNTDQLMAYFKGWQPAYAAGTHRTYSNPGIGMLGMITAISMQMPFEEAMEQRLFHAFGMMNSFINVPPQKVKDYAQGYNRKDEPIRMRGGALASEAYGVKTTASDLIGFIEANMGTKKVEASWRRAAMETHKGHFKSGELIQGLIWEQYAFPLSLKQVLAGNGDAMIYETTAATRLDPPLPPQSEVLINKTGSTNGFAAYVVFIPAQKTGIVILANKNFPIAARVTAAYEILMALDRSDGAGATK